MKRLLTWFLGLAVLSLGSLEASLIEYRIARHPYYRLSELAQSLNLESTWEESRDVMTLASDKMVLKFMPYNDWFWANHQVFSLRGMVCYHQGQLMVPASVRKTIHDILDRPASRIQAYFQAPKPKVKKSSYRIRTIMLDPGHGGKDSGALGAQGLKEKNIVLKVGLRLKQLLRDKGFQVLLTRKNDIFLPLWKRSQLANEANVDLFISLHANAARNKKSNGLEVFYLSDEMDDHARALAAKENGVMQLEGSHHQQHYFLPNDTNLALREITLDEYRRESVKLSEFILDEMVNATGLRRRGVKGARFYVIKHTLRPAVLVEMGFVTNPEEAKVLLCNTERIASSIAEGIVSYSREYERSEGFSS